MSKILDWDKVQTFDDLKAIMQMQHYSPLLFYRLKDQEIVVRINNTKGMAFDDIRHLLADE